MNLLLLDEPDFVSADRVLLRGRRLQHMREIHQANPGDSLRVGLIGGLMGSGRILSLTAQQAELEVSLDQPPPPKLPLTLLLAMPRPKMFRRILQHCATLGVAQIVLLNSYRVEKSFGKTPSFHRTGTRGNRRRGWGQARITGWPERHIRNGSSPSARIDWRSCS